MADDGGVWVKAPQGVSTTGGGIYAKVADDGGKWVEIGASDVSTFKPYLGFSETTTGVSTSSTSFQDVGATVTFTAPPSGEVFASVEAIFTVSGGNQDGFWIFQDNSTSTNIGVTQIFAAAGDANTRKRMGYRVTGLTPATSYTYKLSIATGDAAYSVSVLSNQGAKVTLMIEEL